MAFVDQYALATNTAFIQRVEIAMLKSAAAVQAEVNTTANHTNRANYAKLVLNAPEAYAVIFAAAVAADPNNAGLSVSSPDSDLLFTTNALWNAMAGVI